MGHSSRHRARDPGEFWPQRMLDFVIVQEVLHSNDHQRFDRQRVATHEHLLTLGPVVLVQTHDVGFGPRVIFLPRRCPLDILLVFVFSDRLHLSQRANVEEAFAARAHNPQVRPGSEGFWAETKDGTQILTERHETCPYFSAEFLVIHVSGPRLDDV